MLAILHCCDHADKISERPVVVRKIAQGLELNLIAVAASMILDKDAIAANQCKSEQITFAIRMSRGDDLSCVCRTAKIPEGKNKKVNAIKNGEVA